MGYMVSSQLSNSAFVGQSKCAQMGRACLAIEPQFCWLLIYGIEFTSELMDHQQIIFILDIDQW